MCPSDAAWMKAGGRSFSSFSGEVWGIRRGVSCRVLEPRVLPEATISPHCLLFPLAHSSERWFIISDREILFFFVNKILKTKFPTGSIHNFSVA